MGFRPSWFAPSDRLPSRRARRRQRDALAFRGVEPLERRALLSVTVDAIADADVQNLAVDGSVATANFGGDDRLRVRLAPEETFESFVTFPIDQFANVAHAVMKLSGGQSGATKESVAVGAFRATSNFVEGDGRHGGISIDIGNNPIGEITFNNRPGSTGGAVDARLVFGPGEYYFNLTPYVQEAKAAGQGFVTVGLRHVGGGSQQVSFGSREGSGGERPKLIVEENGAGPDVAFFAPDVTVAGAATQDIVITYSDQDDIDQATVDAGDIDVLGVSGQKLDVVGVAINVPDANSLIVTYTVAAPGGSWDATDEPAYTTILKEGAVKDVAGNPAVGGPDVFTVVIDPGTPTPTPTPPPVDNAKPQAVIVEAPADVTEAGGTGTTVAVRFTDNVGVDTSALTTSSLVVSKQGGGEGLQVLDVGVTPSADGTTADVLFNVIAPGGAWDAADNGQYTVRVVQGAVTDAAGNASEPVQATFNVSVPPDGPGQPPPPGPDTTGPVTTVVPLEPIIEPDDAPRQIRVTFVDDVAVNLASIDAGDIVVTTPSGTTLGVTEVSVSPPAGGASVTATYTITAPGGSWDDADNGVYGISVGAGAASDTSNNPSSAATANFEVAIPAPEPPVDPTFGGGSTVNTGFVAEAAVAQGDGRILVAGRQGDLATGTSQLVLQRLNPDGSADTSFGSGGKVLGAQGANEAAFAIAVDADGNIVVAGRRGGDLMVSRFKANGSLDTRFGSGGVAVADFGGEDAAYSLVVAPDGSILAAGGSLDGAGTEAFAFARFLKDGRPDPFFGTEGRSLFAQGNGGNVAGAVALDASGRVVAAGPNDGGTVSVVRLNANGTEDTSFGTGGVLVLPRLAARSDLGRPDRSIGVVAQPDGSVLVTNRTAEGDFAIAKVRADGTVDPGFGDNGVSIIDFGGDDDADQILLQGSGEILALGTTTAGGDQIAVAAIGPDGSLIRTFGEGGKLTVEAMPTDSSRALRIGDLVLRAFGSITSDGRLVVGASDQRPAAVTSTPLRQLNVPGSGLVGTFGQVGSGSRKTKKLSFPDKDGTIITISMKGAGSGQVFSDGDTYDVILQGVNNSTLTITAKGGNGRVTLRNVQSDGALKVVTGKTTDVAGTFSVNGGVGKVSLGNLTGTIAASGPIGSMAFAGDVKGKVFSGANYGVNGKPGGSGSAADSFGAGRIGKVTVAGKLEGATFAAGVDPVDTDLLDGNDKLVGGSASFIGPVAVKGETDAATRFVAGAFASRMKLQKSQKPVNPLDDPRFMVL